MIIIIINENFCCRDHSELGSFANFYVDFAIASNRQFCLGCCLIIGWLGWVVVQWLLSGAVLDDRDLARIHNAFLFSLLFWLAMESLRGGIRSFNLSRYFASSKPLILCAGLNPVRAEKSTVTTHYYKCISQRQSSLCNNG